MRTSSCLRSRKLLSAVQSSNRRLDVAKVRAAASPHSIREPAACHHRRTFLSPFLRGGVSGGAVSAPANSASVHSGSAESPTPAPPREERGGESPPTAASPADRLVRERGAQEIVEPGQRQQDQEALEHVGQRLPDLEQPPDRPAGRAAGADEFGADEHGDASERHGVGPTDRGTGGHGKSPALRTAPGAIA